MIPLGVFGYATASGTEEVNPYRDRLQWKKSVAPKFRLAQRRHLPHPPHSPANSVSPGTRTLFSKAIFLRRNPSKSHGRDFPSTGGSRSELSPTAVDQAVVFPSLGNTNKLRSPRLLLDHRLHSSVDSLRPPSHARQSVRGTSPISGKFRPRHVEIVIPQWATTHYCTGPSSSVKNTRNGTSDFIVSLEFCPPLSDRACSSPTLTRTGDLTLQGSASPPSLPPTCEDSEGPPKMNSNVNGSSTSLHRLNTHDSAVEREPSSATTRTPGSALPSGGPSPAILQTAGLATPSQSTAGLSGLVCNVHRTTGREPHPLVGATTTILGDKLYVFGGRRLSRTRPQLTADLYELDLVRRHWVKLECRGDIPPPRYFHSVCPLGDSKLVCYGGMSPARPQSGQQQQSQTSQDAQPEVIVMSDIHIFDVPTRTWMQIRSVDAPQGRYAHCASILPSSAVFASQSAAMSAVQHNPSSGAPNEGTIGINLDGSGGAEMVVVGGQDSANHYIEQVSVFNLRSLKWTATHSLGRQCGAYRSVVAPLNTLHPSDIGITAKRNGETDDDKPKEKPPEGVSSMLIYSNYNFLDVKLELQVRLPDGTLVEKAMQGSYSPPGLRFPNGGVINNHFVVSGTFLTSSKQEYALWALDLKSLTWSKIDAGGSIFSQGSWNRGVLWNRRNTFVILGNRKRSLVEDYNHRRINFSNICMVELEAFGLYDNPRRLSPRSQYISVSSPLYTDKIDHNAGGRQLSAAAEELGQAALNIREIADMDFLAITGERIPVNSHIVARRWGPYFNQLLREGVSGSENNDTATLRPGTVSSHPSRNSSITITPSIKTAYSVATTLTNNTGSDGASTITAVESTTSGQPSNPLLDPPISRLPPPASRSRTLYLPHTHLTLQSLIHYLYTSSLPPLTSPLCTPQILCSLLQIARPYQIDGLLEAILERQHTILDGRNTAAIFNAAAMAAGGGSGISFLNSVAANSSSLSAAALSAAAAAAASQPSSTEAGGPTQPLRIDTSVGVRPQRSEDNLSSAGTSKSESDVGSAAPSASGSLSGVGSEREVWSGELSAVVGLQKRGLRGLMEGRRIREMGRGRGESNAGSSGLGSMSEIDGRVGLGIA